MSVHDILGYVYKVEKVAADTTKTALQAVDLRGKFEAVSRAQAMIEFSPDGYILTAKENFLNAISYDLDEIRGQHHRMFVEPEFASSAEYAAFWRKL